LILCLAQPIAIGNFANFAYLHDKYECPVVLLVVCNDAATADWARTPITIGLGGLTCMIVLAWVLGPDNLVPITDPAQAKEDVGLAVLAAITHSRSKSIGSWSHQ
jgi:hypothetical protein